MRDKWTPDEFWAELDALGVDKVRVNLRTKIYSTVNNKAQLAEEWLFRKQQEADAQAAQKAAAVTEEQLELSRSATAAAWASAKAATGANRRSTIALWVAGGSLVVAIVALAI